MRQAIACPECGRPLTSTQGGCSLCLALQALTTDTAQPEPKVSASRIGKYVLSAKLGSGGMGDVWKAWDSELERWVALKLLRHDDPRELDRFTREARTAAALTHPNIAAVYEAGQADGKHYIAMQLVLGRTLDQWPRKDRKGLVSLVRDAARAVGFAHKHGVVHRDLKPTNLMVSEGESGAHVVVLDFGLARKVDGGARLSGTAVMAGTPTYMSPEQTRGRRADARSDVYSLGVTLYEMLTGRPPFESDDLYELLRKITDSDPTPPRTRDRKIDRDLDTVILKCLEKDPPRRYATANALARDLDRWLAGEPVLARPASSFYRIARKLAKRKAAVSAALGVVVLACVLGWWMMVGSPDKEHTRLYAAAMDAWAEARGAAMYGGDPEGIRKRAQRAREAFDRAVQARETSKALWMKGRCLQLEGRNREALKVLERAYELDPKHSEARIELAKTLLSKYQVTRGTPPASFQLKNAVEVRVHVRELPGESEDQRQCRVRAERLLAEGPAAPTQNYLMKGLLAMGNGDLSAGARELTAYLSEERWDTDALLLLAVCHVHASEFPAALAILDQYLNRDPTAYGFGQRGLAKARMGLLDQALEDFDKAIALDPGRQTTYCNRGNAKGSKGQFAEAVADFDQAIRLDPKDSEAYTSRGIWRKALGLINQAIADFDEAIRLAPKEANAYSSRGNARCDKGQIDAGIADYDEAIRLDPKNATAYYNRGLARCAKGSDDEAIADFSEAIRLHPEFSEAYHNRAEVKSIRRLFNEAITDYTEVIRLDPKRAQAHSGRGTAKSALGLLDEAIQDFDEAIRLNPEHAVAYANRGNTRLDQRRFEEALEDFDKAIVLEPKIAKYHYLRGLALVAKGLHREAIQAYSTAIELNPKYAEAYTNRGTRKQVLGLTDEAIADYTKAIEANPNHVLAYFNRGNAKARKGLYEEATVDYGEAIRLDPKLGQAYIGRGHAKLNRGLHDAAIEDYTKAINLDSKSALAYSNRGIAKVCLGLIDEGIRDWQKAIQVAPPGWPECAAVEACIRTRGVGVLIQEGTRLIGSKKYREAIEKCRTIVESYPQAQEAVVSAYNMGCCYALLGESKSALEWLEKAVEMGYKNLDHMEKDSDLDSLRSDERYKKLIVKLKREPTRK